MTRTTIDLDDGVLRELKRRRAAEGRPIGAIASELLAQSLASAASASVPDFVWKSAAMEAKVDLEDKDALWAVLDAP